MFQGLRVQICLCPCGHEKKVTETLNLFIGLGDIKPMWGMFPVCLECYEAMIESREVVGNE